MSPLQQSGPPRASSKSTPRTFRSWIRLSHITCGALAVGLVCATLVTTIPIALVWHSEELRRVEARTLQLVKANIDSTTFPTVAETLRLGQRLVESSEVRGGIVFNALGEPLGDFGKVPSLSFSVIRRDNVRSLQSEDGDFLDVFYPAEVTGLANPIILRLDVSALPRAVFVRMWEMLAVVLLTASIMALVAMAILSRAITRPLARMRDAAIAATDRPESSDLYRIGCSRSDEIGQLCRAVDLLFTAVSIVHREDLAAGREAIERSAFAMLTYDPAGRLTTANPAALKLFGAGSVEAFGKLPPDFIRQKTGESDGKVSVIELLMSGAVDRVVTIATPHGERRCYLSTTTIRKKSGMVLRHMVTLFDLTAQLTYQEQLEEESASLRSAVANDKRRLAEMRGLFEACLIMLPHVPALDETAAPPPVSPSAPTVETERIVNAWYAEAVRNGMVDGHLQHDVLNDVRGELVNVEAVFRQALLATHARSPVVKPVLAVDAEATGDTVHFVVREVESESAVDPTSDGSSNAGIFLLGLAHALSEAGGRLIPLETGENAIAFSLPAATKGRKAYNGSALRTTTA